MTIADAIVYLLATSNCGMRTETIAREINLRGLHHRKDGKPVTSEQVYAVCMANKGVFCKDGGLIRLLMSIISGSIPDRERASGERT